MLAVPSGHSTYKASYLRPERTSKIAHRDRLSYALFLAICLHAAAIFGISIQAELPPPPARSLEVTLAQTPGERPEQADFAAQSNSEGSGSSDQIKDLTAEHVADFFDARAQAVLGAPPPRPPVVEEQLPQLVQEAPSATVVKQATEQPEPNPTPPLPERLNIDVAAEVATLQARLDLEANLNAHGPRVRRLDSISATATADAYYLDAWRRQVQAIGNLNYPTAARRAKIYGRLRLLVAITSDGQLQDVRLLQSSGFDELDQAAQRIVRLAAPFPPFPPELKRNTDVLEIVRTWNFKPKSGGIFTAGG